MSILESIQSEVKQIADERGFVDNRAFGYWYLEEIDDFSMEESEELITDGPWDGGRDAVYFDEENKLLRIYQFKYSKDQAYIQTAFSDVQRAIQKEQDKLKLIQRLEIVIACISTSHASLEELKNKTQKTIRSYLTKNKYEIDCILELYDLRKFSQLSDKIIGVDLTLNYSQMPLETDNTVLGLVDARSFVGALDNDELFGFNIRKFLGIKKGSVNLQIKETLDDEIKRRDFWKLNNGIVCLSTSWDQAADKSISFKDLTIVNGAQTISTIGAFLAANSAYTDPVFVVSKVVKVDAQDVATASLLTKTSNAQTPASNKDLRAVESFHKTLVKWFEQHEGIQYIYRRGDRPAKGKRSIKMKEVAQAYVAAVMQMPHIAFARPGQIFVNPEYYGNVFPEEEIALLKDIGSDVEVKEFLRDRLIAVDILEDVRAFLKKECANSEERKWKSLAYQLTSMYSRFVNAAGKKRLYEIYGSQHKLVQDTIPKLFDSIRDFSEISGLQIPKILKTIDFEKVSEEKNLFEIAKMKKLKEECIKILQ